jgi:hypothetical protein
MKDSNNIDLGELVCSNEMNGNVARSSDMKNKYILVEKHEENVRVYAL